MAVTWDICVCLGKQTLVPHASDTLVAATTEAMRALRAPFSAIDRTGPPGSSRHRAIVLFSSDGAERGRGISKKHRRIWFYQHAKHPSQVELFIIRESRWCG